MKKQIAPVNALIGAALLVMTGCGAGDTPTVPQTTTTPSQSSSTKAFGETQPTAILKLKGHESYVQGLAFSPDGKILASSAVDKKIRLWNIPDGSDLKTLEGHGEEIKGLAFSPDGKLLASASDDTTVKLWNMPDGSLARTLEGHEEQVTDVEFMPDGKTLVTVSWDNTVRFWNPEDGTEVRKIEAQVGGFNVMDISADGTVIATGSTNGDLQTWNAADGTELNSADLTPDAPASIGALSFSPDGKTIVAGTNLETVEVVKAEDLSKVASLTGHRNYIQGGDYSPKGDLFATGALNGKIKVWKAADNTQLYEVEAFGGINGLAFSPDGSLLASTSGDEVWVWASQ